MLFSLSSLMLSLLPSRTGVNGENRLAGNPAAATGNNPAAGAAPGNNPAAVERVTRLAGGGNLGASIGILGASADAGASSGAGDGASAGASSSGAGASAGAGASSGAGASDPGSNPGAE